MEIWKIGKEKNSPHNPTILTKFTMYFLCLSSCMYTLGIGFRKCTYSLHPDF